MSSFRAFLVTAILAFLASANAQFKVFSYYSYSAEGVQPWQLDCSKFTHLIWSFAHLQEDGTISLKGPPSFPDNEKDATQKIYSGSPKCGCNDNCLNGQLGIFFRLKNSCPHVKLLVSIGGWTWSWHFSKVMGNTVRRDKAIETANALIEEFGFDGLDIDWEFPNFKRSDDPLYATSSNDLENLADFTEKLQAKWAKKDKLITLAMRAYAQGSADTWTRLGKSLDYGLVMGYEFQHNSVRTRPGSPLTSATWNTGDEIKSNVKSVVAGYDALGFNKSRIVVGLPLYVVGWANIDMKNRDSSLSSLPKGLAVKLTSASKPIEKFSYHKLAAVLRQYPMEHEYYEAMGTDIYTNSTHVLFAESPKSVAAKTNFAKAEKLAGMMIWNSNQDNASASLVAEIASTAGINFKVSTKDGYCQKESKYCNLRCDVLNKDPLNGADYREVIAKGPQTPSKTPSTSTEKGDKGSTDDYMDSANSAIARASSSGTITSLFAATILCYYFILQ